VGGSLSSVATCAQVTSVLDPPPSDSRVASAGFVELSIPDFSGCGLITTSSDHRSVSFSVGLGAGNWPSLAGLGSTVACSAPPLVDLPACQCHESQAQLGPAQSTALEPHAGSTWFWSTGFSGAEGHVAIQVRRLLLPLPPEWQLSERDSVLCHRVCQWPVSALSPSPTLLSVGICEPPRGPLPSAAATWMLCHPEHSPGFPRVRADQGLQVMTPR
jgi:hypothetical protein